MTREHVVFLLVECLVLLSTGLGVLGWKYLVRRAESAGAAPSAQALAKVQAELSRLTHASGLYVQRQHEVYAKVYRALRFSRDQLAKIDGQFTLEVDLLGLTADELDKRLAKTGFREPSRRKVLADWGADETARVHALQTLQLETPGMYYSVGMKSLGKAVNEYLGNLLYFSAEGIDAMEDATYAFRHYAGAMEYGHQRVRPEELATRRKAMDDGLDRAYALLRKELKEPSGTA
jgi:hypothetical protein